MSIYRYAKLDYDLIMSDFIHLISFNETLLNRITAVKHASALNLNYMRTDTPLLCRYFFSSGMEISL